MLLALVVFVLVAGAIMGGYAALTHLPGVVASRRLDRRLRDVSFGAPDADPKAPDETVVKLAVEGPLPGVDRLLSRSGAGFRLAQLIAQSGVRTSPSAVLIMSAVLATTAGVAVSLFVAQPFA